MVKLSCEFNRTMRLVCMVAALLCANRVGRFFILNDFSDTDDFADACHVVVFIKRNIIIVLVH